MKKLLLLLIPVLIGTGVFLGFRYIASSQPQVAALQVTATPQAEVFLDGASLGKTPLYNEKLTPGEHTVKLVAQQPGVLSFEQKITLRTGVLTVIDRMFKGTEAESEISLLSLEPIDGREQTEIAITSSPQSSEVKLDEQTQGVTPILLKDLSTSDHQISISKDGYHSKLLRVAPKPGYRLTIFAKLAISQITQTSPTPSPTEAQRGEKKVTILDTPTGFLRVRAQPSTQSEELTRVAPQDTFPLIEEGDGWYKIQLPDGKEGWVSSRYARIE